MRKDKVVYLLNIDYSENEIGDTLKTLIKRQIFAEKKSVRQSEFYQAAATGLKPELTFVIWEKEYNEESMLEFEGREYTIIRMFQKDDKDIELVCSGLVSGVN